MNSDRKRWELCHIALVNWYLFSAQDIPVKGRIALTGPNGAGKSSILDAMQTVLTGRSGKHLHLNSLVQTGSAGRRTVRDYILGTLDDAEDGATVIRQQAIAYLMLGFQRNDGEQQVTIGLCLSAKSDADDEDVVARFIVEGRILTTLDVAQTGEDEEGKWAEAKHWAAVASDLRNDGKIRLTTESGPEVFVRTICRILGPDYGSVDPVKFLRNLRNAAAFKPVGNTTDFVRNFILDQQTLNLTALRDSIARFKAIQSHIQDLKKRIAEVEDLESRAEKIRGRQRTTLNHRLNLAQGRIRLAAIAVRDMRAKRDETANSLDALSREIPLCETNEASAEDNYRSAVLSAASNETVAAADRAEQRARTLAAEAASARLVAAIAERLGSELSSCAQIVTSFDAKAGKTIETLIAKSNSLVTAVLNIPGSPAQSVLADVAERIASTLVSAELAAAQSEKILTEMMANLKRAKEGKRSLSGETQRLMDLLTHNDIKSMPLCDLVDSVESEWRRCVEAILGGAREALVVEPRRYETALSAYRKSGSSGGQLVNTTKTKGTRAAKPNSLATAIETDDDHARAFLDFRLGGISKVYTEADLAREESAATPDLMFATGRTVRRLHAPRELLLGSASNAGIAESLEGDIALEKSALTSQKRRIEQLRSAHRTLIRFCEDVASLDVEATKKAIETATEAEREAEKLSKEAALLRSNGDQDLSAAVEKAMALLNEARAATARRREERSKLDERLRSQEAQVKTAEAEEAELRTSATSLILASEPMLGIDIYKAALAWVEAEMPDPPELRTSLTDPEAGEIGGASPGDSLASNLTYIEYALIPYHAKRLDNERPNFVMHVGRYLATHSIEPPSFISDPESSPEAKFQEASAWVQNEKTTLSDMVLKDYEDRAAEAYADAISHFKGDFVGKMRGAFEAIRARLRELNRQLAKRDFHGLTYRFAAKASHAHRDMIALIDAAEKEDFQMDAGNPNDPAGRAMRRLEEIALDPNSDLADLEDPRRYFEFDIDMDKDGVARTTMSKRLGTGSGGQVQVPFYVAICAALASTYYPDRAGLDGALCLAVFDEAFNRMDTAVIGEVIGFMDDVGLQPFIAAPDKERATFMQFADTLLGISRTGTAVTLDIQYLKPKAHEAFRQENPHLIGFEAFVSQIANTAD